MNKVQNKAKQMLNEQDGGSSFDFSAIPGLCISNWFWFVLCVTITCSAAFIYLRITQPIYVRSASLVVKDAKESEAMDNVFTKFRNGKSIMPNTSLNNEIIAFRKPDLMEKVVKQLNLDTRYEVQGHLRNTALYGSSLPIIAKFSSDRTNTVFDVEIKNGKEIILKWDKEHSAGHGKLKYTSEFNKPIKTPFGYITIIPSKIFLWRSNDHITVIKTTVNAATQYYLRNLYVANTDERSSVIDLSLTDVNIERADDVLNTLIAVYNEQWIEDRNQIIKSTNQFIQARLVDLEKELGDVENEMSDYQISNHTLNLENEGQRYMQRSYQYDDQGLSFENELALTQYFRNHLNKIKNFDHTLPLSAGINNPALQQQVNEYNGLVLERSNLISASSESNPMVGDIIKQMEVLRRGILSTLDTHLAMLNTQVQMLHSNNQRNNKEIDKTPSKAKKYVDIERRRKIKEQLYTYLLQTREQNNLNQTFDAYNTRILQRSSGSSQQAYPNNKKVWMIALGIGLGFPFLVIVLREFLNTKVRGRKDIEKLSIPFVGELPQLEFPDEESTSYVKTVSEKIKNLKRDSSVNRKKRVKSKAHIVVKQGSRNIINEAFRVLRTNVEFMIGQNKDLKVIMTTSANPGSGKTFISYNLAKCMSLKGKKVCAIDLDLRRRSLSDYVGKPDQGVSDYINGAVSNWRDILVTGEGSDTFFILPAGTLPPNPAEIISYDRFTELINEIREEFDYVFFDCPPVEIVADTSILAKHADISLFVIRVGLMELDFLPIIEEYYDDQRFNNMGIILNGTLTANSRYGYRRYGYRYGYGYGYGYGGYGYYGSGYSEGYSSKEF